jgi:RNA polymerase sigma-70 factor (ECF subfamily)
MQENKADKKNADLLSRCRSGENAAFKQLYDRYARAMLNASMRIVNDSGQAEDILQDSFIKAFQNLSKFEAEPAFASWLKRVVVNASIDHVRKQKNRLISADQLADVVEETEATDEEEDYDIDAVKSAIRELPDGYRIVLTLFLFEDYSHKDIAAMLSISEGTSKSQYMRAKQKLILIIKNKKTVKHGQA